MHLSHVALVRLNIVFLIRLRCEKTTFPRIHLVLLPQPHPIPLTQGACLLNTDSGRAAVAPLTYSILYIGTHMQTHFLLSCLAVCLWIDKLGHYAYTVYNAYISLFSLSLSHSLALSLALSGYPLHILCIWVNFETT